MRDLIDRAEAIEEIARRDTTDGTIKVYSGREVVKILNELPSAQPTQPNTPNALELLDCISRQAAIDAVRTFYADEYAIVDSVEELLEKLPSAQSDIVRCKDCKRWNTVIDRTKAEYGLCQIRTQLEATKRDDWCSRAERRTDEQRRNC